MSPSFGRSLNCEGGHVKGPCLVGRFFTRESEVDCFGNDGGTPGIGVDFVGDEVVLSLEGAVDINEAEAKAFGNFHDDWFLGDGIRVVDAPVTFLVDVVWGAEEYTSLAGSGGYG